MQNMTILPEDLPEDIRDTAHAVDEVLQAWNQHRKTLTAVLQNERSRAQVLLEPIRNAFTEKQAALHAATQRIDDARKKIDKAQSSAHFAFWHCEELHGKHQIDKDDVAIFEDYKTRVTSKLAKLSALVDTGDEEVRALDQWLTPVRAYLSSVDIALLLPVDQGASEAPEPECYADHRKYAPFQPLSDRQSGVK